MPHICIKDEVLKDPMTITYPRLSPRLAHSDKIQGPGASIDTVDVHMLRSMLPRSLEFAFDNVCVRSQLELLAEVDHLGGWVVLRQLLQWNKISADQHEDAF